MWLIIAWIKRLDVHNILGNCICSSHQLYLVRGPSQEIASLESELDVVSAKPVSTSESGQLEALVRLSPEDKQKWFNYFDQKNMSYTIILDDLAA